MACPLVTRSLARRLALPGAQATRHMAATSSSLPHAYSTFSTVHENDPDKLDGHKQNSLAEQKAGKGQWREELASDAEAVIKAEREDIQATGEEIKKLQRETNELLKKAGIKPS
ncbi:hypothetical protein DRE_02846 [Drechslerella stenobrocha 248]|uniref:Mitochondrial ATPase inhibitor n=1 Tax=Drechslerella stenobrocha 248 TaxID=1043628 RepID=W7HWR2_9PEZI|nr:hypothetical protein DRE_02846 [Drechslerella stenobrocha 248]